MLLSNRYVSGYSAERLIERGGYTVLAFAIWVALAAVYTKLRLRAVEEDRDEARLGASLAAMRPERVRAWQRLIRLPVDIFWLFLATGAVLTQALQLYVLIAQDDAYPWLQYAKSTLFNGTAISGIALVYYGLLRSTLRRSLPALSVEEARGLKFSSLLRPLTLAFVCASLFPVLRLIWIALDGHVYGKVVSPGTFVAIATVAAFIAFAAYAILSFSFFRELRETTHRLRESVRSGYEATAEPLPIVSRYESGYLTVVHNELQHRKRWEYAQLEKERQLAANVQRLILHNKEAVLGDWRLWGELGEGDEIGVHFCDVVRVGEETAVFAIGKVSGNGMPAALVLSAFVGMLRSGARNGSIADIAARMNASLWETLKGKHTITVMLGLLDCREDRFDIVAAGVGSAESEGRLPEPAVRYPERSAPAIGFAEATVYATIRTDLKPGQRIRLAIEHSTAAASLEVSRGFRREGAT